MFKIKKTGNLDKELGKLVKKGEHLGKLMDQLGAVGVSRVRLSFSRSSAPDGDSWDGLKHRSGRPLRDSGRLMNSITYIASRNETTIGTNVFYAPVHQFGATIKAGTSPHMTIGGVMSKGSPLLVFPIGGGKYARAKSVTVPARPFLPENKLPASWSKKFSKTVMDYLEPK